MTESQQQAKELIEAYLPYVDCGKSKNITTTQLANAKECALIAVNKVIGSIPTQPSKSETERLDATMFWVKVQEEIKKFKP